MNSTKFQAASQSRHDRFLFDSEQQQRSDRDFTSLGGNRNSHGFSWTIYSKLWLGFVLVNKERNNIHITTHPISCWVNAVLVSNDLPELGTDLVASVCPRKFKHIEKQVGFPIKRFPIKRNQNTWKVLVCWRVAALSSLNVHELTHGWRLNANEGADCLEYAWGLVTPQEKLSRCQNNKRMHLLCSKTTAKRLVKMDEICMGL